jgi:hypothetical protein
MSESPDPETERRRIQRSRSVVMVYFISIAKMD